MISLESNLREDSMYMYNCELVRVIDGDTVKLKVDCGFRLTFTDNFRLAGIDAPEQRGEDRAVDIRAKEALVNFLEGKKLVVISEKHGKYRWLADLLADGESVNDWMVSNGHAVKYDL